MTHDLWMLLAAAGLQWVLIMIAATPSLLINGIPYAVGNRHTDGKELPLWADRARRAAANLQENLILFAIIVLVVHVVGAANETTEAGTTVFLFARIAHAVLYMAGVSWLRTVAWAVGVVAMFIAASPLL